MAKTTHALRSVVPVVNHSGRVECVVDPGCQVVAMSEEVSNRLVIPYDPTVIMQMISANGTKDFSLGIARNVPFRFGDITLYLQVHVLRHPAYDVLLGRPFDVLTQSVIRNYDDERQTITIRDPNSGQQATIPTIPRGTFKRTNYDESEEDKQDF